VEERAIAILRTPPGPRGGQQGYHDVAPARQGKPALFRQ